MNRDAKFIGFVVLLAVIFIGAHVAGSRLGPLTTSRSQVSYTQQTGGGKGMAGMGGHP